MQKPCVYMRFTIIIVDPDNMNGLPTNVMFSSCGPVVP